MDLVAYLPVACSSNISDYDCIEEQWGQPASYSVPQLSALTIGLTCIFLFGCFGNLITCLVIARTQFMWTATNFYLFNLSFSDLVVLLSRLPYDLLTHWRRYPFPDSAIMCVGSGFLAEMCTYCSALTVTALTAERYWAICYPMRVRRGMGLGRSVKVIVSTWMVSGCLSAVMSSQLGFEVLIRNDSSSNFTAKILVQSRICEVTKPRRIPYSFLVSSLLLFVCPMLIIAYMYVRIGAAVHRSLRTRKGSADSVRSRTSMEQRAVQKAKGRKTLLKLLVGIVLAFFLCYAPFHLSRILADVVPKEAYCQDCHIAWVQQTLFHMSGLLFFGSSIVNPILYNLMSLKFRRAFQGAMVQLCRGSQYRRQQQQFHIYDPARRLQQHQRQQTAAALAAAYRTDEAHPMRQLRPVPCNNSGNNNSNHNDNCWRRENHAVRFQQRANVESLGSLSRRDKSDPFAAQKLSVEKD